MADNGASDSSNGVGHDNEDDLSRLLTYLDGQLITLNVVMVLLKRAGIVRSEASVRDDAESGRLRVLRVSDRYAVTLMEEGQRYVADVAAQQEAKRQKMAKSESTRRLLNKIEGRNATA